MKTGDDVEIRDRLYAIITARGKLAYSFGDRPIVYSTRKDALAARMDDEHVVRLKDVGGTVIR